MASNHKKAIFPLLLKGEPFGLLIGTQYDDVTTGQLPPEKFFTVLARAVGASMTSKLDSNPARDSPELSAVSTPTQYPSPSQIAGHTQSMTINPQINQPNAPVTISPQQNFYQREDTYGKISDLKSQKEELVKERSYLQNLDKGRSVTMEGMVFQFGILLFVIAFAFILDSIVGLFVLASLVGFWWFWQQNKSAEIQANQEKIQKYQDQINDLDRQINALRHKD